MNIENMLDQLKDVLPAENFKIQPAAAREELLQLEDEYKINTSSFIENKSLSTNMPENVHDKWINTLDTFINFNGSMEDLNHLSSSESSLNNKPFINQISKESSTKEYVKKKSKESGWLPCLFIYMNNFVNLHSLFRMKQESGIRT
ncbi:hypothetical protein [Sporosarcina limicola]|uniref:Uncharacterized protein n=1 Tax=Sporosarcina limicola TaxID=34101 RepID=A0A927MKQ7_9BACL|nr:hypothetical protein [Sporosarcina limicola]MBE1556534.1 hypothetical protein [Sporosarcina limicola]